MAKLPQVWVATAASPYDSNLNSQIWIIWSCKALGEPMCPWCCSATCLVSELGCNSGSKFECSLADYWWYRRSWSVVTSATATSPIMTSLAFVEAAATTFPLSTSHMSVTNSAMLEVKKCKLKQASPTSRAPFCGSLGPQYEEALRKHFYLWVEGLLGCPFPQ